MYWVLAAGMISFSFSPILIRFAGGEVGGEAPGLTVAVWRTMMAAVVLAPFAWVRARAEIKAFDRREWYMILSAGILLGMHFVLWIESLYHTTVAAASVLVTTSPVFLAVLGYIFLNERLSKPINGAILLAVAGAATIGAGDMLGGGRRRNAFRQWVGLDRLVIFQCVPSCGSGCTPEAFLVGLCVSIVYRGRRYNTGHCSSA